MVPVDLERVVVRPLPTTNIKDSPPTTSLTHAHISEALAQSPDDGATLDLAHKNLTDVGDAAAEELATIGRQDLVQDESSVLRYASVA